MIKDTLYGKYLAKVQNVQFLEDEQGFIFYKITKEECFIMEMGIDDAYIGTKKFKLLLDELTEIAKQKECTFISANIHVANPGANHSLRSALHYGFKLNRAENGVLLIILNFNEGV